MIRLLPCGFNPRTREGATSPNAIGYGPESCFNPRTREGATLLEQRQNLRTPVSIHAPVRVRRRSGFPRPAASPFQSTHP